MSMRRLGLTGLMSLCTVLGLAVLSVVSAQAQLAHKYLRHITEVPAEGPHKEAVPSNGVLKGTNGLAIDSGRVWLAESEGGTERVDAFSTLSGSFESQLSQPGSLKGFSRHIAIRHETPEIPETETYLSAEEGGKQVVSVFGRSGNLQATWAGTDTPGGSFTETIQAIAVDNSKSIGDLAAGDVYVATSAQGNLSSNVVDIFKPEAGGKEKYVGQLPGPEAGGSFALSYGRSLAVDELNGDVIVGEGEATSEKAVYIFEPTAVVGQYALVRTLTGTPEGHFATIEAVAVDGSGGTGSDDIYVVMGEAENAVDQFSSEGVYLGRLKGTPEGEFAGINSIAVDPATGYVYTGATVVESVSQDVSESAVDIFGPSIVIPDVDTGGDLDLTPASATLTGTVNPDEAGSANCQFVWGTSESFGEIQPCTSSVEGDTPVGVQVRIGGKLQPDTTYYYRLQATNSNGTDAGEPGQTRHFTTPGPGIKEESASDIASTSATLRATVNSNNAPMTSYFQYGITSQYGDVAPAPPGEDVSSGESEVNPQHVQGLSVGTVYHYRLVTIGEVSIEVGPGKFETHTETFYGPDKTFSTQPQGAFALPDGRQWEMVSPPEKRGAVIEPIVPLAVSSFGVTQAAAGGDAMTYLTTTPTETQPRGFANLVQVLSTRGPQGWASQDITTAHEGPTGASVGVGNEYRFFSEDLSLAVMQPFGSFVPPSSPLALSKEESEQTAFMRTDFPIGDPTDTCTGSCYRPLVTGAPGVANVPEGTVFGGVQGGLSCPPYICGPQFVGATPDGSHVVLSTYAQLAPTPAPHGGLYEWAAGKLQLVSVLPEGEGGGAAPGGTFGSPYQSARHAISNDGSRVVWSIGSHLYLRDTEKGETLRLDVAQGLSGPELGGTAGFMGASSDGSKVFFTDTQRLTNNAGKSGSDLYECEIIEVAGKLQCKLSDLTPSGAGKDARVPAGAVIGLSDDGSWVYFVADSVLASGAVPGQCENKTSTCNLYVHHEGVTKLVAVLSGEDAPDWSTELKGLTARVSPNGHWFAFMSQRELTDDVTRDAISGQHDEEVYLYDAQAERIVCASCDPTGARPVGIEEGFVGTNLLVGGKGGAGGSYWPQTTWLAADIPGWTAYSSGDALYQSRYLSDSGRLFFNSHDALVPQDVNGTWDVYQYEPSGVGACSTSIPSFSERSDGCVGLISSGNSGEESAFLDAGEGGGDVFFLTLAKLVPQDVDTSLDVYDAHECTASSPCLPTPATQPPPCTTGDACKAAPSPQPTIFGSPSSATFSGAGNVTPVSSGGSVKTKSLTRAQKLTRALKACHPKKRKQRVSCERKARTRYGAKGASRSKTSKKVRG